MSGLERVRSSERAEPVKPQQAQSPKKAEPTAPAKTCAVCSGRGRVSFGTDDSECGTCGGTGRA